MNNNQLMNCLHRTIISMIIEMESKNKRFKYNVWGGNSILLLLYAAVIITGEYL